MPGTSDKFLEEINAQIQRHQDQVTALGEEADEEQVAANVLILWRDRYLHAQVDTKEAPQVEEAAVPQDPAKMRLVVQSLLEMHTNAWLTRRSIVLLLYPRDERVTWSDWEHETESLRLRVELALGYFCGEPPPGFRRKMRGDNEMLYCISDTDLAPQISIADAISEHYAKIPEDELPRRIEESIPTITEKVPYKEATIARVGNSIHRLLKRQTPEWFSAKDIVTAIYPSDYHDNMTWRGSYGEMLQAVKVALAWMSDRRDQLPGFETTAFASNLEGSATAVYRDSGKASSTDGDSVKDTKVNVVMVSNDIAKVLNAHLGKSMSLQEIVDAIYDKGFNRAYQHSRDVCHHMVSYVLLPLHDAYTRDKMPNFSIYFRSAESTWYYRADDPGIDPETLLLRFPEREEKKTSEFPLSPNDLINAEIPAEGSNDPQSSAVKQHILNHYRTMTSSKNVRKGQTNTAVRDTIQRLFRQHSGKWFTVDDLMKTIYPVDPTDTFMWKEEFGEVRNAVVYVLADMTAYSDKYPGLETAVFAEDKDGPIPSYRDSGAESCKEEIPAPPVDSRPTVQRIVRGILNLNINQWFTVRDITHKIYRQGIGCDHLPYIELHNKVASAIDKFYFAVIPNFGHREKDGVKEFCVLKPEGVHFNDALVRDRVPASDTEEAEEKPKPPTEKPDSPPKITGAQIKKDVLAIFEEGILGWVSVETVVDHLQRNNRDVYGVHPQNTLCNQVGQILYSCYLSGLYSLEHDRDNEKNVNYYRTVKGEPLRDKTLSKEKSTSTKEKAVLAKKTPPKKKLKHSSPLQWDDKQLREAVYDVFDKERKWSIITKHTTHTLARMILESAEPDTILHTTQISQLSNRLSAITYQLRKRGLPTGLKAKQLKNRRWEYIYTRKTPIKRK